MSKSGQTVFLAAVIVASCLLIGYLVLFYDRPPRLADSDDESPAGLQLAGAVPASRLTLSDIPFDGARAYEYLKQICAIGPRFSGSPGMESQQKLVEEHFQKLGGKVSYQRFRVRHPLTGEPVPMANMIVQWHPDRRERILLCAHYDTRPFPDRDPQYPHGTFLGANDGASGVALLMELGEHMPKLEGRYGVDFVLFDGEELVYREQDRYFIGSEYFARNYVAAPPEHRYRWGVLLDMIGDTDLQLYYEGSSISWRDTRPLTVSIWETARRLGVKEFIPRKKHQVNDDHLMLRNIAKIPTCDVIDFDYPHWHTEGDTADKCSALSLAKVGWVINEWLHGAVKK